MAHIEKVTPMVLKVDLQCPCCYKKVKKTLCKFPQIRDQVYDEKANTVTIIVVCCSPEKIRDKLCYKGGKVIKSIEIKELGKPEKKKEPEKPKEPAKPKEPEKPKVVVIEKPKEPEKPKVTFLENPKAPADKPKDAAEKPKDAAAKPKANGKADKPKSDGAPPPEKPKEAPKGEPAKNPPPPQAEPVKAPAPVTANGVPSVFPYIGPSYDGYNAGPYYHGYGFPQPPPQPCYEGYYGNGHEYGNGYGYGNGNAYGYGRVVQGNRYDNYSSEENPQGCSIM